MLGQHLKALREGRDITQAALAERMGVHAMWISRRERGETLCSVEDIRRISAVLDLTDEEVLLLHGRTA